MKNYFKHHCANNDLNGNPQRVYVLYDQNDSPICSWDEGYLGHHCVPEGLRLSAYSVSRVNCSVRTYESLRKLPSFDCVYDVPGYAHLRPTLVSNY